MALIKCPKCGNQISEYALECPICGTPNSNVKSLDIETDIDTNQSSPNIVSTPNDSIDNHSKFNETQEPKQKSGHSITYFIIGVIVLITVGSLIAIGTKKHQEKLQEEQEWAEYYRQQEQLRQEQEQRREQEQRENKKKERMRNLSSHNWKTINGDIYRQCILTVLSFNSNGTGYCSEQYYVGGNRINVSGFGFNYYIDGDRVYISGDYTFDFDGYNLTHRGGERYSKGSSLYD